MNGSIYPGYKPNPPREQEGWTEEEWDKFMDFINLLKSMKKKNEVRNER